jgi:hypothetical protein
MPYNISKVNNQFELRLKDTNQLLGKHKTKQSAKSQIMAIEINKNKSGRKDPKLWEKAKDMALEKFGKHSARMIQYAGKIYRDLGGEYEKTLSPSQKSLKKWTKEEWGRDIPEGRYLPKKVREELSPEDYLRTSIAKMKGKTQYVKQPEDIVEKIKKIKGGKKEPSKVIDGYRFFKSEKPKKKLKVEINGKWVHFGQLPYEHFFDKTGLLDKDLNHGDDLRRKRYLQRSIPIRDKEGNYTVNDKNSPNYWAVRVLW